MAIGRKPDARWIFSGTMVTLMSPVIAWVAKKEQRIGH